MMEAPPGGSVVRQDGKDICIIDPEFRDLLEPLTNAELEQLRDNLIADGRVIDPIVVWQEEMILLDGHNRLPIAIANDLNFTMVRKNFANRSAALCWVIDHQQGRRNLSEEAKRRLTEWRRDRVTKGREEGKSTRQIAKEEKVSTKTVRKDLAARGKRATPSPAEPVKGRDGRVYKSRQDRLGLGVTPPLPKVGERQPGDDTESEKAAKEERRTDPKSGRPLFDWAKFNQHFAAIMIDIAKFAKAYKVFNTDQRKALTQHFADTKKEFATWYKAIAKQKAPMEPHERGRKGKK